MKQIKVPPIYYIRPIAFCAPRLHLNYEYEVVWAIRIVWIVTLKGSVWIVGVVL